MPEYEVHAIRYATVERRARENFLVQDFEDRPMPMVAVYSRDASNLAAAVSSLREGGLEHDQLGGDCVPLAGGRARGGAIGGVGNLRLMLLPGRRSRRSAPRRCLGTWRLA